MSNNQGPNDWRQKFDSYLSRMEIMGVKAANKFHRFFINCIFVFIGWNMYSFAVSYNNYWRLRRDPNIPRQWLEEQTRPGEEDWKVERERHSREERIQERRGGNYYG